MENTRVCTVCKIERNLDQYISKAGRTNLKNCLRCRNMKTRNSHRICEHNREFRRCKECGGKDLCQHQREKCKCKDCGGGSICEHNRVRSRCKECGGGSICEHKRVRTKCKDCHGGSLCEHKRIKSICKDCDGCGLCEHKRIKRECRLCGDGKKIKIKRMVYNSKKHDMKLDRYDANNHVDYCFIEQLMDESMNCSICDRDMQLITTNVSLCTLMQKSLKVGFIKSNCVLGCFDCKTYQQGCGTDEIFELYKEKNNYKTEKF